jgi:hypothetical protein
MQSYSLLLPFGTGNKKTLPAPPAIYTNYGSDGADLMGMQDQTFQFYGPLAVEPIKWAINIYPAVPGSTFSLLYRIDSTWVPMGLDYTLPPVPLK